MHSIQSSLGGGAAINVGGTGSAVEIPASHGCESWGSHITMSKLKTIMFIVTAVVALRHIGLAQKEIPMPTEKGNITLIFNGFAEGDEFYGTKSLRLQASIRNDTPFKIRSVIVGLNGYDAAGNYVPFLNSYDGSRCSFELFDSIEPGQTLPFKNLGASATIQTPRTVARLELKLLQVAYFIKYDVQSDPVVNENFAVYPSFGLKGIGLEFRNKSSDVIEVAWDQSVYIDENGNSSRLIRGNVSLAEKDRPQPNTVVPPGTHLQETVFPVDRIQREDGKWTQVPMLPDRAYIFDKQFLSELQSGPLDGWVNHVYLPGRTNLTGKEIRLFLRLIVGEQKQNVTVTFKIVNMVQ